MALENEKKTPHASGMIRALIEGTFVGTFIRWVGWPIEKVYYDYLDPKNTKLTMNFFVKTPSQVCCIACKRAILQKQVSCKQYGNHFRILA